MGGSSRAPGLLIKTVAVTFLTVFVLLVVVFALVTMRVRGQVRDSVTASLESTERLFAQVETRRQSQIRATAASVAENPTLKAALDTYTAEARTSTPEARGFLLTTITRELDKVANTQDADAIVLADPHMTTIAAAGRVADRWPAGRPVAAGGKDSADGDSVVQVNGAWFRLVGVPLVLDDGSLVGTLFLANDLDQHYADDLKRLFRADTAIVSDGLILATTLPGEAAKQFEAAVAGSHDPGGQATLDGQAYAYRRLVQIGQGQAGLYALDSIDESSRPVLAVLRRDLLFIGAGAVLLALLGSLWLAHLVTKPIGTLSASLEAMAASHRVEARLPLTGSSRELDTLTDTFNALMASVEAAEAQREAAYTGAIRALATALDARDPYTAGHSERVSVVSVAIARALGLPQEEIEVIRLGALLHDIGKIGVPDDVLRKAGALTEAEFASIKQHPVLGARILRSVPFLARHIPIVELHHERPDGRGYPHGLRADDIPLAARVVHVADAYDAITSARAYRGARPPGDALREIWRCSGTEFHAEIVGALATALPGVTSEAGDVAAEIVRA